ncbi:hypothetical protein C8Q80DRAFT_1142848 [Daedaleopsis nitida]|nr:hypothetical protein C8Q80DRAFT_1142848 [Daedaleopsis nitida]
MSEADISILFSSPTSGTVQTASSSRHPSGAAEPPRKRQRTTPFASRESSPMSRQATPGLVAGQSSRRSTPPLSQAIMSNQSVHTSSAIPGQLGAFKLMTGNGSSEPPGDADMVGGGGDAEAGMKGEGSKGKRREMGSHSADGDMVWEADHGGASSVTECAARSPLVEDEDEERAARDGEFYIDTADCVIRVDNTLFRVHRYFLGRDSSAFQHMFSIPNACVPSHNLEGYSDDNPIRLYGESVERFKALLSVIYDLPLQLQVYNTPAANVERLLTIAEMADKYHFASIETWAVDALYNVISGLHGPPQPEYELTHCSSAWMKRLLEVALLCGHTPLRNYVADRWVERILARDLRPVHALEIADRSGIRRLQGYAYYVQLLEMDENFEPGVVEDGKQYARSRLGGGILSLTTAAGAAAPAPGTPAVLTREQKQRLLSGHWSLTRLWEHLRLNAPKFQRSDGCAYHQHGCVTTWMAVWREVARAENTLRWPGADVVGRLKAMEEQLFMHADLSSALSTQCKRSALLALKATMKEVQEGLADRFVDRTAAAEVAHSAEGVEGSASSKV